jgi:hypothetical protein
MSFKLSPSKKVLVQKQPKLFGPKLTRGSAGETSSVIEVTAEDLANTNFASTSSFRYDPPGTGLKSTQQVPVDYSRFENHTFFNSAEVNVNVAFDTIINAFPFDGTQKEVEEFLDDLSGFEKYVLDSFPKNKGYLFFKRANPSFIAVNDFAGSTYPSISKEKTGNNVLDPGLNSFSLEMQLFVPDESNDCSVIAQKLAGTNHGFTLAISESASSVCDLVFMVTSGSHFLSSSIELQKGRFNHVGVSLNRAPGRHQIEFYSGSSLVSRTVKAAEFGRFNFSTSPFLIGSGSTQDTSASRVFTPITTLSGAIDELRFRHENINLDKFVDFATKGIFTDDNLALYFKFNEPTGSLGNLNNIVLDSSGNSLHSRISNYTADLRSTGSIAVPMTNEKLSFNPVLFPSFASVVSLNSDLLTSASLYDRVNPNLITRLVPPHYLQEGQVSQGFAEEEGTIVDPYGGSGPPGTGELGSSQLLSAFLYTWAKFFDEQKIMTDHMSNLLHVDYDDDGTVADQFLPFLFNFYGVETPAIFPDASIDQFFNAENIQTSISTSGYSLDYVQNQIWRRILVNIQDIIKSKGTIHAVKSLIRTLGINPDTTLRIREYGGKTKRNLVDARVSKTEVSALLDMSGTLAPVSVTFDGQGIPSSKPFVQSNFLTASRIEPGKPNIGGAFVDKAQYPPHGISNNRSDGLLTSGSWSIEGTFKFENPLTGAHPVTQSLFRLNTTGSTGTTNGHRIIANIVAISGNDDSNLSSSVKFFVRASSAATAQTLELPLTGVNIFDGNKWSISAGRVPPDAANRNPSGSYFLRAGYQAFGELGVSQTTQSFFLEDPAGNEANIIWSNRSNNHNSEGAFITAGSQSLNTTLSAANEYLNSTSRVSNEEARVTTFSGKVGQIRFWSKNLETREWKEHTRNFKSIGVEDPDTNFNFVTMLSGSFEKIRLDVSTDQPVTNSSGLGRITLTDFSQGGFEITGSGFEASKRVIKPETFYYSHLSPRFDEAETNNKVRVRGFQSLENVEEFNAEFSPSYEIRASEIPNDDTRFSIDISVVNALNEDIVNIFATLDEIDNALGDPELLYSPDYPKLAELRSVYFNRLTRRMNLSTFFEFFKWFDSVAGTFIEQVLPRKTSFLGVNYVVESHMLERSKVQYLNSEIYLEENLRRSGKNNLIDP